MTCHHFDVALAEYVFFQHEQLSLALQAALIKSLTPTQSVPHLILKAAVCKSFSTQAGGNIASAQRDQDFALVRVRVQLFSFFMFFHVKSFHFISLVLNVLSARFTKCIHILIDSNVYSKVVLVSIHKCIFTDAGCAKVLNVS